MFFEKLINFQSFLTFSFLFVVVSLLQAQDRTPQAMQVALTYKICENIVWTDQDELNSKFIIGYLGDDKHIVDKFQKLAIQKKVGGKQIVFYQSQGVKSFPTMPQVVLVDESYNMNMESIQNKLKNEQVLIVTYNFLEKKDVMINLYMVDDMMKFEVNHPNLLMNGMHSKPELLLYGGTEIDIVKIYKKAKEEVDAAFKSLEKEKQLVDLKNKEIHELSAAQAKNENELRIKQKLLRIQKDSLSIKNTEIELKNEKLNGLILRLNEIENDFKIKTIKNQEVELLLVKQEENLESRKNELMLFDKRIDVQKRMIADQNELLSSQETELKDTKLKVELQKNVIMIIIMFLVLVLILVLIMLKLVKDKSKAYLKLSEQSEEMLAQKDQLQIQATLLNKNNTDLHQQKVSLEEVLYDLKSAQNKLIIQEKMASLGQITAGIAHEINTPIGAIKSSAENINTYYSRLLVEFPKLIKHLSDEEYLLFLELTKQKEYVDLSTREQRKLRKELLEVLPYENAADIAPLLVDLNVTSYNWMVYSPLLAKENSLWIIETGSDLFHLASNALNIEMAVGKASKVLFALKKYSRGDVNEAKTETDIEDNICTVLMIYKNHLKNIDLKTTFTQFEEKFYAFQNELSQVWTNLVYNALQAMDFKGELSIEQLTNDKQLIIKIKDSGPGIPFEIRDRIFDPLFTTKPEGEGTGLGLDIVSKIIEKHNGTITFETEEGIGTCFIIILPLGS